MFWSLDGFPFGTDFGERDLYCGLQYVLPRHEEVAHCTASDVFLGRPSSSLYTDRVHFQGLFLFRDLPFRNRALQPTPTDVILGHKLYKARYVVLYPAINPDLLSTIASDMENTVDGALVIAHVDVEAEQVDGALCF